MLSTVLISVVVVTSRGYGTGLRLFNCCAGSGRREKKLAGRIEGALVCGGCASVGGQKWKKTGKDGIDSRRGGGGGCS